MPISSAIIPTCRDCKGKCDCPKTYSDTSAQWGAKSKDYLFFGYKVHLIVDAKSQLPLEVIVTPGNEADSPQAIPLLYLALCAQVIKRIGAVIKERLNTPHPVPCPVRA